jgi:CTP synthase
LKKGTKAYETYQTLNVKERHRHRYEFNNEYLEQYQKAGMVMAGINRKDNLVEIIELEDHPWFVGVQFHPEYQSTVAKPHPLFVNFVAAALKFHSEEI